MSIRLDKLYRVLLLALLVLFAGCSDDRLDSIEVEGVTYLSDVDYIELEKPIRFDNSPVPNVLEIFWYGCPHCEKFEPLLHEWIKELPAGMRFGRSPAIWKDDMVVHAKAYFIAEQLELGYEFHRKLFVRILALRHEHDLEAHKRRIATLFLDHGVNQQQFDKLYASAEIQAQVASAAVVMKQAQISSTPSFLINGKYRLDASSFKTREQLLLVAKHLVQREIDQQLVDWL